MSKWIKELDLWENFPQIYISKSSKSQKSLFNGCLFSLFLTMAILFFILQFISFIQGIGEVVSSTFEDKILMELNYYSDKSFYGMKFSQLVNRSFEDIPALKFHQFFEFYFYERNNEVEEIKNINSSDCTADNFYDTFELQNFSSNDINYTNEVLNKFTCYLRNDTQTRGDNFFNSKNLINFNLKIRNDSFNEAIDFMKNGSIQIQIIYPSYFLDIQSRKNPFLKLLKTSFFSITPYFKKEIELYFSFFKVYDDFSQLSSMDYKMYTHPNVEYDTGFYYSLEERIGDFSFYPNRTTKEPELLEFTFQVSDKYQSIYRNYSKFTTFLAGTNSIIASLYSVITILGKLINSVDLNISITRNRMYTKDISEFLKEYVKDDKSLMNRNRSISKNKDNQEIIEITENKHIENHLHTDSEKSDLCQKNIIEKYLNNFCEQEIKNCRFYHVFPCCKHKNFKDVSYDYRMENVISILSTEKFFQIHDEFNLLKKILFGKDELITFELISKLQNCFYNKSPDEKPNTIEIINSLHKIMNGKEINDKNLRKLLVCTFDGNLVDQA